MRPIEDDELPMTIKIFVDDIRNAPKNDKWVLVRTNARAIRLIMTGHVEEISLDHDICFYNRPQKIIEMTDETYMPIAYFLSVCPEAWVPKVIWLHSANPDGRRAMFSILHKYRDRIIDEPQPPVYKEDVYKSEYGN